jgi:predicted transcriptional regulator
MVGPDADLNDLLNKIDKALVDASENDKQPENTVTVQQYAKLKNLSRYCAQDRLSKLFRLGMIDRVKWCNRYCYYFK